MDEPQIDQNPTKQEVNDTNGQPAAEEQAPANPGQTFAPQPEQQPDSGQPAGQSGEPAPQQPAVSASPKPKRGGRWLIYVLVIVILAAAGAAAYMHFHKKSETKATNTAAQAPKPVQHLSVGIQDGDFGTKLYPLMENTAGAALVNYQIFEGLVSYENGNKVVPNLASGWTNPDDSTWLFTIKKGVKFHDGNTMTAADVAYSLNTLKNETTDYAQAFAGTINEVQAVGSDQVKVTTTQPDPAFLNKLTSVFIIDRNLPKGDDLSLAGTGPYEIKPGTTPNHLQVDLTAVSGYHGGTVWTKGLSFGAVSDLNTLLTGYKNHTYNMIGEVPFTKASQLPGSQYVENDTTVVFLAFNANSGPLANQKVREAIRYAVDPVKIGLAAGEKVTPLSQLIPPAIPGYNPSITPYKQNVAKAKQLLAQAGYPNGVTLTFATNDNSPEPKEAVSELKAAGINITSQLNPDFDSFLKDYLNGKGQIFYLAYSSNTLDGADILQSTLVPANYQNQSLYDLIDKAATTVDPATRLKLLQQASTMVDQNVPIVPLSNRDNIWLMDNPYKLHQDLPSIYTSVYFYKVHQ